MQAVEGKKLAESWGATFMESSARETQVLGLKTRKVVGVAVSSLYIAWWWGWEGSGVFTSELGGNGTELTFSLNAYPL